MLWLKYLFVFVLIAFIPASNGQQSRHNYCVNPLGKYGQCIELVECPQLLAILQQIPINRESVKFLQKSTCGFTASEDDPKVCCANKEPQKKPTTTTTTEKPHVPDKGSTSSSSVRPTIESLGLIPTREMELTMENHPNFRLLPTDKSCGLSNSADRIVGGEDTGLGTYPWMVLLGISDIDGEIQWACGGTLISKRYVITAAHCVVLPTGYKLTLVRIGEYDQTKDLDCSDDGICAPATQDIEIQEIIAHELYDKKHRKEHDIALLRLKTPATFSTFVAPVCLPTKAGSSMPHLNIRTNPLKANSLLVAGWGRTETNKEDGSAVLQHVLVPLVSFNACNQFYKRRLGNEDIGAGRFCAGGERNKDSCKGDSGGPVMGSLSSGRYNQRTFQFGIVSIGPPTCAGESEPALYTRVVFYMKWVLDTLKP